MTTIQNQRYLQKIYRTAIARKNQRYKKKIKQKVVHEAEHYKKKFKDVSRKIHCGIEYEEGKDIIPISEEFGLEKNECQAAFFDIAKKCLNSRKVGLEIDFQDAEKIWPSAITFLCSLKQWVEMDNKFNSTKKHIYSTNSNNEKINAYLYKCGFYDYVRQVGDVGQSTSRDDDILKIRRELDRASVEEREDQIMVLLKQYSDLSEDQLELFNSIVLTETFLNVTEHGIVNEDEGWWVLAQVHKKHKFISLYIADNGIGFVHTLINGPQCKDIKKLSYEKKEGKLIRYAFTENVSGAWDALRETRKRKSNRGARRGNGLKRIKETCEKLEIDFSIVSHKGYYHIDNNGKEFEPKSFNDIVFGGTMYCFLIPTDRRPKWTV